MSDSQYDVKDGQSQNSVGTFTYNPCSWLLSELEITLGKTKPLPGVMACAFHPSSRGAETGGSLSFRPTKSA